MIKVERLSKSFSGQDEESVAAVRDLSFQVEAGEFYTLLGPSGCGKTTTLRCIAGFERPESGEIRIGEQLAYAGARNVNVPPHKRDFGIVFQSYAIWPHMTVFENVAFPLLHGRARVKKKDARERVAKALQLVQLDQLADRPAPLLSGGQQQRVALARALVHEPRVLLLDEPLSNLDAKLREEMRLEIRQLVKRLGITALYVTHDQLEALTMSDRIAVMNAGRIIQEGTPVEIYKRPSDPFVARFIGMANFLEGRVAREASDGYGLVETTIGTLRCHFVGGASLHDRAVVMIRPEDIAVLHDTETPVQNAVDGRIEVLVFTGDAMDCRVSARGQEIRVKLSSSTVLQPSSPVKLHFPAERCLAIQSVPQPTGNH
jgi:iron(III) transport system ATP-binding protein